MKYFKSQKLKLLIMLSITLLVFGFLIVDSINVNKGGNKFPQANSGVIDFTHWNFKNNGMINLNGQWEFYKDKLISPEEFEIALINSNKQYSTVPGIFATQGYGTYRLKVLVNNPNDIYSIKIDYIQSAYKLWVNDSLVMSNGVVGSSKEAMTPQLLPKMGTFSPNSKEFYITLQVSNYYSELGFIDNIVMGDNQAVSSYRDKKLAFDLFILGSTFIAALYNLGVYVKRRKDKAPLYFAIVCLFIAIRTMFIGERFFIMLFPGFSYQVAVKIMVLTFYVYIPFIVLFINKCYGEILLKDLVKISTVTAVLYTFIAVVSPIKYYLQYIIPFEGFALGMLLYMMYKISKTHISSGQPDYIALVGLFALFISRVNDILYEYSIIISTSLAPLGTLVFIIANYYVLAGRQSNAYNNLEVAREKLESINKLKDDFLAVTSHELKTPISGIVGLSESLINKHILNAEDQSSINLINLSVKRLANLVEDMMLFSRLKNNNIKLHKKPIKINRMVDNVIRFLETSVGKKEIKIINLIDKDVPYIVADENRIQQILYNLISNSIKFTHTGNIVVSYVCNEDYIEVSVEDQGIGIPKDKLQDIFKIYEQVEGISSNYGGTGIGLYITKQLVELHKGSIKASSDFGKGSKFTFSIPLATGDIIPSGVDELNNDFAYEVAYDELENNKNDYNYGHVEEKASNTPYINNMGHSYKILVVDDEYINQKVLENYLSEISEDILIASSGKEALDILELNEDIDLIILDMMMPDLLGYEVSENIRKKKNIFELPILIMTADRRIESLISSFECGANDYLNKPFDKNELLARVTTLLTLKSKVKEALSLSNQVIAANKEVKSLSEQNVENNKKVEALMEYDKIKTEFFTNISHELKTPLNVISSTIQLLESLDRNKQLGDEKIKYYFKIMNQNSLRLLRLINNLIDTTKIDGGYIGLNLKNDNIVYVVEEICQSVTEYGNAKKIEIIFDTDIEEKIMAFDEEKIERIILNILSNAIKFTKEGGSIFINIYDKDDNVEISVKDTGIGIPRELTEYIFERFAQIDKSITRQNEGSGIGLALVKSLVEMHEGTIRVVSEVGLGSEFIINLPVRIIQGEDVNSIAYKQIREESKLKYDKSLSIEFSDIYL
ncbi:ATP-binding protein [Clostridium fungisolvens]|uniref:Circadian input-output histidine kinase CikA n=1 Tax=Clostridium fungisolvens TaxID=1604897 RepID=A0A6V8SKQ0_9CLOT|nr:ATP-binding protein [Clostridium fungisolvens]GFP77809.1 Sensor histidine kinase RcsC [Clostridium fungisolvens]